MKQAELRRLARLGAEARLGLLHLEIDTIYRAFPDLRSGQRGASAVSSADALTRGASSARRRPKLSAAARKRIADAQRKRWAEWKARQAKPDGDASTARASAAGGSRKKK